MRSSMRIIYVLSGTSMQGGATKSFLNLLREVCKEGNKALVICPDKKGIYEYIANGSIPGANSLKINYTYDILPFIRSIKDVFLFLPRLIKRFVKNRLAANKLITVAQQFSPDLIHTNTSVNNIGFLAAKSLGIPHIWHIREYGWADFKMKVPFQRTKLRSHNNYTISITKDIHNAKHLDYSTKFRIIYNGIVSPESIRYCASFEDCFLYVGRVTENKGALNLLEAYYKYVKTNPSTIWKLKFVGSIDNTFKNNLISICKSKGIDNLVEFSGVINDVNDLMYRIGNVIVPSYKEGFGRVLPEAMSNGCLTIARNTGGSKEQYDNGISYIGREIGLRFNTTEELTNLLLNVSANGKQYYESIIKDSQVVVASLYSIQSYCRNILRFYRDIIESKI